MADVIDIVGNAREYITALALVQVGEWKPIDLFLGLSAQIVSEVLDEVPNDHAGDKL